MRLAKLLPTPFVVSAEFLEQFLSEGAASAIVAEIQSMYFHTLP
jgi:hypothetical protein